MLFAVLTLLFGFGLGIVFGLDEDIIKLRLKASAAEVRESVYHGNDVAIKTVLDKSWVYAQRAHLHALDVWRDGREPDSARELARRVARFDAQISLGLGDGWFGLFRVLAGGCLLGDRAGKDPDGQRVFRWLAILSSGAMVVATAAVALLLVAMVVRRRQPAE